MPESPAVAVARLRAGSDASRTHPLSWRRAQLRALAAMMREQSSTFKDALRADLHKSPTEAQITELAIVVEEIQFALRHVATWVRPRSVPVPAVLLPARASVRPEPVGVVMIIAPWNYPIQLALAPLVGALAAGNAVVLKPSELAPATSAALAAQLPRYLDREAVAVVEGGVEETTALLECQVDHIFFTGSTRVGQIVMSAAAKHLTPVTLELGGKSPTYVDDTVDLARAADRIAWGKFVNAGQTCVAPDYLLATPGVARRLEPLLTASIARLYGADPARSPDYGRIVNRAQFDRLAGLLDSGRAVVGGDLDAGELYLAPTVLVDVDRDAPVMTAEIFGPILPIITVDDHEDAIAYVRAGEKPLTAYVFSHDPVVRQAFLDRTSSGSLTFDIPLAHLLASRLPFGGVGASGMGAYHGETSFATFSHAKSILDKGLAPDTMSVVYPPFPRAKRWLVDRLFHG